MVGSMIIFDIETTGLDPASCQVRCFAALDISSGDITLRIASGSHGEKRLLRDLRDLLVRYDSWSGWNIEEFDIPFISERCGIHGLDFPPLEPLGLTGKYGKERYGVSGHTTVDLAYAYQDRAEQLGIEWRLQAIAQVYGWRAATSLDGAEMPGAVPAAVAAHCLDDIDACRFLADDIGRDAAFAEEQSSWLGGTL